MEIGCFSDYGTLRTAMVGSTEDLAYPAWSPNIRYLRGEQAELLSNAEGSAVNLRERAPDLWEAVTADMESLVEILEQNGVEVVRPRKFLPEEMEYLEYLQGGHSLLYPADPNYVLGKHVIECCIRRPFRRKETWATRDVLMPQIEADPEVKHVSIPRARPHPAGEEGPGPFLEGGDLIMLSPNDVLCGNTVLTSNAAGRNWLTRYLEPFGIRVHPVDVQGTWLHLLGVMCVLREGLAMAHLPALGGSLPEPITDWDVIELTGRNPRPRVGGHEHRPEAAPDRPALRARDRRSEARHGAHPPGCEASERLGRGGALCVAADRARRRVARGPRTGSGAGPRAAGREGSASPAARARPGCESRHRRARLIPVLASFCRNGHQLMLLTQNRHRIEQSADLDVAIFELPDTSITSPAWHPETPEYPQRDAPRSGSFHHHYQYASVPPMNPIPAAPVLAMARAAGAVGSHAPRCGAFHSHPAGRFTKIGLHPSYDAAGH